MTNSLTILVPCASITYWVRRVEKIHHGPVAWARAIPVRVGRVVEMRTPALQRKWKAVLQQHMKAAKRAAGLTGLWQCPVSLTVQVVFRRPKDRKGNAREWHTATPDADNITKAIKDAGNKLLYRDDAQVSHVVCLKLVGRPGEEPYIRATFRDLTWVRVPAVEVKA